MLSYEGQQALDEIARHWALHDGMLREFVVRMHGGQVVAEALCTPRPESDVRELRVRLRGVTRFDISWAGEQEFYLVSAYKAVVRQGGTIYLSFDPYDDRDSSPHPQDGGVIEARHICAEFILKTRG